MRRVVVIGAGLTKFVRRANETPAEMAWQATSACLESAGVTLDEVEAVCHGTAPDAFDGYHMKGEFLSGGSGAFRKPYMRGYVGGGTGVFTPAQAFYHIASGMFDTCLAVCEEKMSACQPHPQGAFVTIYDHTTERPLMPNLLWIFALEMNRYMTVHNIKHEDIALVSVKNKRNAMDHPSAQLGMALTLEEVVNAPIMAWPVTRNMVSPTSDGAGAVLLASEEWARKRGLLDDKAVYVTGVGWNLDTAFWTNRDLYYPEYVEKAAKMAYKMAGISDPQKEIHVAEPYDPFAYKELHHMEGLGLADKGQAPRLTAEGVTQRDGARPMTPSGGLLGVGNPIAAAGMMKICEIYWQLRGEAGARQVKREVKTGLAQAWGDLMQVGTVVVMSTNRP